MAYRKSSLRRLSPEARKLARLIGDLQSVARRLKPMVETVARLELDSRALFKAEAEGELGEPRDLSELFPEMLDGDTSQPYDD